MQSIMQVHQISIIVLFILKLLGALRSFLLRAVMEYIDPVHSIMSTGLYLQFGSSKTKNKLQASTPILVIFVSFIYSSHISAKSSNGLQRSCALSCPIYYYCAVYLGTSRIKSKSFLLANFKLLFCAIQYFLRRYEYMAFVADIFSFLIYRHDLLLYKCTYYPPITLISLATSLGYNETQKNMFIKKYCCKNIIWLLATNNKPRREKHSQGILELKF